MTDGLENMPESKSGWRKRFRWLLCLWLIAWLGICADQATSYTNFGEGLVSGVVQGFFHSPILMIPLIPVGLIGWAIGSISWLRPARWRISLILPMVLSLLPAVTRVRDRWEPGRRFERMTEVAFPKDARNVVVSFTGGYMMDIGESYTFECSKEQTDVLIRRLGLKKSDYLRSNVHGMPGGDFSPGRVGWQGGERWASAKDVGHTDFFELFTDESHTRVHIVYGTI